MQIGVEGGNARCHATRQHTRRAFQHHHLRTVPACGGGAFEADETSTHHRDPAPSLHERAQPGGVLQRADRQTRRMIAAGNGKAVGLTLGCGAEITGRQQIGAADGAAGTRLIDARSRDGDVEVLAQHLRDDPVQYRVAKAAPPLRVCRGIGGWATERHQRQRGDEDPGQGTEDIVEGERHRLPADHVCEHAAGHLGGARSNIPCRYLGELHRFFQVMLRDSE